MALTRPEINPAEAARQLATWADYLEIRHIEGRPLVLPAATVADLIATLREASR